MTSESNPTFDQTWDVVGPWKGWLRQSQARLLWDTAKALPSSGTIVEIGSYRGKSTAVLGRSAPPESKIFAIDPHAGNDRGPGEWTGSTVDGDRDRTAFVENLSVADVANRIEHVRKYSQLAHDSVVGPIDLLYVDGAHGFGPASDDLTSWGGRVRQGGDLIVHDVYNSIFVTLAIWRHTMFSGTWRYVEREQSMVRFRREDLTLGQTVAQAGKAMKDLPYFCRNVVLKALRAVGLEPFGRLLGHKPGEGMY